MMSGMVLRSGGEKYFPEAVRNLSCAGGAPHGLTGWFVFCVFQAEDGIRDLTVTGVQTCALPIFTPDGTEYVIRLGPRQPPLPWTNVVANPGFGFLVSESGAGSTWSRNSHEHRLTPWYNDPIADPHGEALYVRDEEAGVFWSPLPGPVPGAASYEVRHGFGYTRFRHPSHGPGQGPCLFVPVDDPVKVVWLRLTNTRRRARRLSLFAYFRLVLGVLPGEHVGTELDAKPGTLLARNPDSGEFAAGVVFPAAAAPPGARVRFTADPP